MAELNIAIADDNRQTLEMLGEILESEKDYHVVGKADNGNEGGKRTAGIKAYGGAETGYCDYGH